MKYYCIFETNHPNKHSELSVTRLVCYFENDYQSAEEFHQSLCNFNLRKQEIWFSLRCLDELDFEVVNAYSKANPNADIEFVYSLSLNLIVL